MRTDKKLWRNRKARKELARRLQSENPGLEVVHPRAAAESEAALLSLEVGCGQISYREWFSTWPDVDLELAAHRAAIIRHFQPVQRVEVLPVIFRPRWQAPVRADECGERYCPKVVAF